MQTHQERPAPAKRSRAEYQAKRRTHSVLLYFRSVDELASYRAAAEAGGYGHNFNAWLLQMLANPTSGMVYPPEYVDGFVLKACHQKPDAGLAPSSLVHRPLLALMLGLFLLLPGCLTPNGPRALAEAVDTQADRPPLTYASEFFTNVSWSPEVPANEAIVEVSATAALPHGPRAREFSCVAFYAEEGLGGGGRAWLEPMEGSGDGWRCVVPTGKDVRLLSVALLAFVGEEWVSSGFFLIRTMRSEDPGLPSPSFTSWRTDWVDGRVVAEAELSPADRSAAAVPSRVLGRYCFLLDAAGAACATAHMESADGSRYSGASRPDLEGAGFHESGEPSGLLIAIGEFVGAGGRHSFSEPTMFRVTP